MHHIWITLFSLEKYCFAFFLYLTMLYYQLPFLQSQVYKKITISNKTDFMLTCQIPFHLWCMISLTALFSLTFSAHPSPHALFNSYYIVCWFLNYLSIQNWRSEGLCLWTLDFNYCATGSKIYILMPEFALRLPTYICTYVLCIFT